MILTVLLVMMAALFGCSTFPEPQSKTDTVFVLPVKNIRTAKGWSSFGYYEIEISSYEDKSFSKVLTLTSGSGNEVVTGLEPGRYAISSIEFLYKYTEERGEYCELGIPFVLKPGSITISPATVVLIKIEERDTRTRHITMGLNIQETSKPIRESVLDELREYESISKWRVLGREEALGQ
jgi:hypothetical protein